MKGYKVTDNKRSRKIGVGADSLKMLKDKLKVRFSLKNVRVFLSLDGFEISDEEYFQTIPSQSSLIVADSKESAVIDSDFNRNKLRNKSALLKMSDIIEEFIQLQPAKFHEMVSNYENGNSYKKIVASKTHLSLKAEHPEWFLGCDKNYNTKEEAMIKRAQDRVKTYYFKCKTEITRTELYRQNLKARDIFDCILEKFRYLLIGCNNFSMMFNRTYSTKHEFIRSIIDETDAAYKIPSKRTKEKIREYTNREKILNDWSVSLCTTEGTFYCCGVYSNISNHCNHEHTINPYRSREDLILFQVWNLDHQIELSRSIIPALIQNVRDLVEHPEFKCVKHKKKFVDISILEYFLEIFSLKNLKLVHIVCHEKTQRPNKSNGHLICERCSEFKIVKDLINIKCPEDEVDFLC